MLQSLRKKFIGTPAFYKKVMALALPIMIQNGITNLVNMIDNIMVGAVGTVQMTGVAVTNQLIFVFNLCIFGAVSGAGIFLAQFFGKGDSEGMKYSFRYKLYTAVLISALGVGVFLLLREPLIRAYLQGEGAAEDIAAAFTYAEDYLFVMLIGLLPFALVQAYSSSLRETGHPTLPMVAGLIAVATNLALNYVLIFGKFGAPALGVVGAAVATVISRFVELFIVVFFTHRAPAVHTFAVGVYRGLSIPAGLVRNITVKATPLMINETLWAAGGAVLNQCYSLRNFDVVAANNINTTFFNVFSVAFMSVGVAIGIIHGQNLGAGRFDRAKEDAPKLLVFSVFVSFVVCAAYFFLADAIPFLYNTTPEIRVLATDLMKIAALAMPLDALANASYFTLRSGGKTGITFLFDSCFVWVVNVPTAVILSRFTAVPILPLYAICQAEVIIKDILGVTFVHKGIWIRDIT